MKNDNSATFGMVALALAVFLSLVALFAAPWLARWLAESATAGYGYAYAYDYPGGEARPRYWPLGSTQLLLAFLAFLGGGALVGWLARHALSTPEPRERIDADLKARIDREVRLVDRRRDLTDKEKNGFQQSANSVFDAKDRTSREVARLVGDGNAVTGARLLADKSQSELIDRLSDASNLAAPFSDKAEEEIATLCENYERFDALVKAFEQKEKDDRKAAEDAKKAAAKAKQDEADRARLKTLIEEEREKAKALLAQVHELTKCASHLGQACNCGQSGCAVCNCDTCRKRRAKLDEQGLAAATAQG